MNNNTQIETVEQFTEKIVKNLLGVPDEHLNNEDNDKIDFGIRCINFQKQQEEAKYKELLDSHNGLLKGIEEISEVCNGIGVLNQNWLKGFCEGLINKAKNIKQ